MRVEVVSPWYPDRTNPYSGVFVHHQVEGIRALGHDVSVEVPLVYPAPAGPIPGNVLMAMERLGEASPDNLYHSEGSTTWVPTPVPSGSGYTGRSSAFARHLKMKRRIRPSSGDITHAHLGVPTGWATLQIAESPVVITEHQSTLAAVFSEPTARDIYLEAIYSAAAFLCVSETLKARIVGEFGDEVADRIRVLPNIVDLSDIPFRRREPNEFRSWVYVGGLATHKGVVELMEAFATYKKRFDTTARLTLVGTGPLTRWVEEFATKNAPGAVELVGAVSHERVGTLLNDSDLMVHLSPRETFGLASLEALGAGLPVVSARNGGSDEAWGDIESESGILVDPGASPDAIATAIAELRNEPDRLRPDVGRRRVEERYGAGPIARELVTTYFEALG